jgi:hypothetical protein
MVSPNSVNNSTPRYATKRTKSRQTRGHEIAAIAQLLGTPLLPWQRLVADIGTEMIVDRKTGLIIPAYREICITIPRQSGKTTLTLAWQIHRALRWATPQRIAYSAQTGWDARRKLIDDQVPMLERTPLAASIARVYRGAGAEAIIFKNGSRIETVANTLTAMHGKVVDLCIIDEAFADEDDRREQSALPAMATRRDAQLIIVSTAGTQRSTYLNRKIQQGREAVKEGRKNGIAYFEWSADPEEDPEDETVWEKCMPALGLTIDAEVIRHAFQTMPLGEFQRAYLNNNTTSDERLIPMRQWSKVNIPNTTPTGELSFAVDVALDRSAGAIAVCDRQGNIEIVDAREGVSWIPARAKELARKYRAEIIVDGYAPAGSLMEPLEALGLKVIRYGTKDVTAAVGLFYDALLDGSVKIRPHDKLDEAAAGVIKRMLGQSWLWSRSSPAVDITPLFAATLAWHHATQRQEKTISRSQIF